MNSKTPMAKKSVSMILRGRVGRQAPMDSSAGQADEDLSAESKSRVSIAMEYE
jgi:hypothetical protein